MTEQPPPETPADEISNESPLPHRSRFVAWATLGAVGVAAAIGAVVAINSSGPANGSDPAALAQAAAATSPSPSASGQTGRRGPGGPGFGGFGGLAGPRGPVGFVPGGKVLHGESTVQTNDGKTQIVDTQTGTISAVDSSAKTITVASTDKVTFTYGVDASTRLIDFAASSPTKATLADLKVGDAITVVATRSGDTRTATSVVDGMPTPGKNGPMGTARPSGQPWAGHPGPGKHAPQPSASATGASA